MKKFKPTVTVGIPAFNEERNIQPLLKTIFSQDQSIYKLIEVIIVSDGSTDLTEKIIESNRNKLIKLFKIKKRTGQNNAQNLILRKAKGTILVILDADTLLSSKKYIQKLIEPIVTNKTVKTFGASRPVKGFTFLQKVLFATESAKLTIFNDIFEGDNLYNSHSGKALKNFRYSKFHWPVNVPEDAYFYLYAKHHGELIEYTPLAVVLYHLPKSLSIYYTELNKFRFGRKALDSYFPHSLLKREYKIPFSPLMKYGVTLVKNPFVTIAYILIKFRYTFSSVTRKIKII